MKKRLFVDLDGTCAEWKDLTLHVHITESESATPEAIEAEIKRQVYDILHQKGYYYNLKPYQNVCDAVNLITKNHSDEIEVYVLSAAISKDAVADKNKWVDKYMPGIPMERRIYTKDGDDKSKYIPGSLKSSDTILDDYNTNLAACEPPATSIKILNNINSADSWPGNKIRFDKPAKDMAKDIVGIVRREITVHDKDPLPDLDRLLERKKKPSNHTNKEDRIR